MRLTRRIALPALLVAMLLAAFLTSNATGRSQSAPTNTKEPVIAAPYLVEVGTTLNGNKGSWSGTQPLTFQTVWLRCNANAEGCSKIANTDNDTQYKVANADSGRTIRFSVTASNADGSTTAKSNATSQIPTKAGAPIESAPPTISGQAVVGETLTATTGSWKGTQPISYTFKWQTCNPGMTSCTANGDTGNTYTIAAGDNGKRVRVRVQAKNADGESAGLSDPTDVIQSSSGGGGGSGNAVSVDSLKAGERLIVDSVQFSPNPVTSRSEPIRVTIRVKDTNGKLVRGAFVFFRSTPIVTSTPTDAQTDSNGIVVYTIQPESDFPLKNGYNVQFFVKAYRKGDPALAGVSGTRLVQVATKSS
jgi:hypothetical protein